MNVRERKLSQVPITILLGFALFLIAQLSYHYFHNSSSDASFRQLTSPRNPEHYRAMSSGSDRLLSYLLLIGVQLHDNQKGLHVSYNRLDYRLLSDWLLALYELNPDSDYPAFLAARVYSQVEDKDKLRRMVGVVELLFDKNPQQHWRRMTEACLILKHQLKDLPEAFRLAEKIASLPAAIAIPFWARDMKLVLLDELGELESAQLLISSMLQSGEITDADETRFLQMRLLRIQQNLLNNKQGSRQSLE